MGCGPSKTSDKVPKGYTHLISVTTGDKKGAGTDGNIYMTLEDEDATLSSETLLDTTWKDDFESGSTDLFYITAPDVNKISRIHIRRDETAANDAWYVEVILVQYGKSKTVFPVHRWIHANSKLSLEEYDCTLPQHSVFAEQRKKELELKQEAYKLKQHVPGAPMQVESLPSDENFSNSYQWDIKALKLKLFAQTKFVDLTTPSFETMDDFVKVYKTSSLPVPYGFKNWTSDAEFGNQRLSGCNPNVIVRCDKIPENMATTEKDLEPFLEGLTFSEAVEMKKIYLVDLTYLAKMECSFGRKLSGPLCLLYSQKSGDLVPIAIQLMPDPAEDNPVFYPSDPKYTWLAAKIWFNNADASHHQSATHLGMTHLVMESVAIITHRQLSPSHPIFRLLAPHFIYLLAINTLAVNKLVSPGGWVDLTMTIGRDGMFNIVKENWAKWNIMVDGHLRNDLKSRGVDDPDALPNYHYRDDALLLWDAIHKFVTEVISQTYDTPEKLAEDYEVQNWAKELGDAKLGGNFAGVPSSFTSTKSLQDVVTAFIFIGSVGHAAANFCQYDEYAFPPNYPAMLNGERPKDKSELTEDDIVKSVPPKELVLSIMIVTRILSNRGTNALTNYEVQYAYDPITTKAVQGLKDDLRKIGTTIDERNAKRTRKYLYLHPSEVPNAISI